jgi:hypothetical protein
MAGADGRIVSRERQGISRRGIRPAHLFAGSRSSRQNCRRIFAGSQIKRSRVAPMARRLSDKTMCVIDVVRGVMNANAA